MTHPTGADPPGDLSGQTGERRAYGEVYESVTFPFVTRGGREMVVTLSAQPVFDL